MVTERFHERVAREPVGMSGWRFTCQQCGASVGVPNDLVAQWEREQRLDTEIEQRLTRSLLLRVHLPKRGDAP